MKWTYKVWLYRMSTENDWIDYEIVNDNEMRSAGRDILRNH